MNPPVRFLGGLLLALSLSGCFLPSQYDPFAPGVSVVIENRSGMTAQVYLLRFGANDRLGSLGVGETEEFRIPWIEGGFRIRVELPGRRPLGRGISARPGETFRYLLEERRLTRIGQE